MKTICPKCGKEYDIMASLIGTSTECECCGANFTIQNIRKCPYCDEVIKAGARLCKHCKSDLPDTSSTSNSTSSHEIKRKSPTTFIPFDVKCQNCGTYLEVNINNLINNRVDCPHCHDTIYIQTKDIEANRDNAVMPICKTQYSPINTSNRNRNPGIERIVYYQMPEGIPKLYTPGQVAWASFLGSAMGGAILMALNASRLKRDADFSKVIVVTVIGFIILGIIIVASPQNAGPSGFIVGAIQAGLMFWFSTTLQGKIVEEHQKSGGEIASSWGATAAGLTGTVIAIVIIILICIFASSG